jgi:hypothetical protein
MGILHSKFESIQAEFTKNQKKMMISNMDRQMRVMQATQMAFAREQLNWMLVPYTGLLAFIIKSTIQKKPYPPALKVPLIIGGCVIGYQLDWAYGTKADRVRGIFNDIIENENHWFSIEERENRK